MKITKQVKALSFFFIKDVLSLIAEGDVLNLEKSIEDNIDLKNFKTARNLSSDAEIPLQSMSTNNTLSFQGKLYHISTITTPVKVFTDNAAYMRNGIQGPLPSTNIFESEDDNEIVTVFKDQNQEVKMVTIIDKNSGEISEISNFGLSERLFGTVQDKDIDYRDLNDRFRYSENPNSSSRRLKNANTKERNMQQTNCERFRIIELAVDYESSFCISQGSRSNADERVVEIIASVSRMYQQSSCLKVEISHLNGYCTPGSDPYREDVKQKKSGCSGLGLLHSIRDMWEHSRSESKYDAMHLFSGTTLECESEGCIIGCAFSNSICTKNAFGVNHITFNDSLKLQSVLVAHELGHIAGAYHESRENYIMYSKINNASNGFCLESINAMEKTINKSNCVEEETIAPSSHPSFTPSESPSTFPTSYPTAKPSAIPSAYPSLTPSFHPSAFPTKHPISEPSNAPSTVPTTSYNPSSSPSIVSSYSPSLSSIRFEESSKPSLNNQFVANSPSNSALDKDEPDNLDDGCRSAFNLSSLLQKLIDSLL